MKHFLIDQLDRDQPLKLGGGQTTQWLNQPVGDSEPVAVVEQAIATFRTEAESASELARFEVLQRWLVTPSSHDTAIEAARSLNLSEGAFKVAVHRLRKRFRHVVVDRIASTVSDPKEAQDELNYLINAITLPMPIS